MIIMSVVVLNLTQVSLMGSHEQHEWQSRLDSLTTLHSKKKKKEKKKPKFFHWGIPEHSKVSMIQRNFISFF